MIGDDQARENNILYNYEEKRTFLCVLDFLFSCFLVGADEARSSSVTVIANANARL